MTPSASVHRRPDGSIDFDSYRRAAASERQEAMACAFARAAHAIGKAVTVIFARSAKPLPSHGSLAR